jgi:hypothetical protein
VRIPIIEFGEIDTKDRLEAIQAVIKNVAPNYIVKQDGYGFVWSKYLRQNALTADYEIKLIQSLQTMDDPDVYTRVKMFGENAMPKSILPDGMSITSIGKYDYQEGEVYEAYASQQPLCLLRSDPIDLYVANGTSTGKYYECGLSSEIDGVCSAYILTSPTYPVVWINGQKNSAWAIDNYPGDTWGYWTEEKSDKVTYKGFWFVPSIDRTARFIFYSGDVIVYDSNTPTVIYPTSCQTVVIDLYTNTAIRNMEIDADEGVYKLELPKWSNNRIASITSITIDKMNYSDKWELKNGKFYIKKDYILKGPGVLLNSINQNTSYIEAISMENNMGKTTYGDASMGWATSLFDGKYDSSFSTQSVNIGVHGQNWIKWEIVLKGNVERNISSVVFKPATGKILSFWGKYKVNCYNLNHVLVATKDFGMLFGSGVNLTLNLDSINNVKYIEIEQNPYYQATGGAIGWWNYMSNIGEIEVYSYQNITNIRADFWYRKQYMKPINIEKIHDGDASTQVQTILATPPLARFKYIIFNLKETMPIDAIDMTAGFYIPNIKDQHRKYETNVRYSIEYRNDNTGTWLPVSADASNFALKSGETKSFEGDQLGSDFAPKQLAIVVEGIDPITGFGVDKWVISLVEFSCYKDTRLRGEVKVVPYGTDISTNPEDDTYGCIEDDSDNTLLNTIGDRMYKSTEISKYLNTKKKIKDMANLYLEEYIKNLNTGTVSAVDRCDMVIGDTCLIKDPAILNDPGTLYFIGAINNSNGINSVTLARYI